MATATTSYMRPDATTAPTGAALDLGVARHHAFGIKAFPTKLEALGVLAAFRACGRNRDRDIEVHRARTPLARFWVIGRPDHFWGITYLMTGGGEWVAGRLTDSFAEAVPWSALGRQVEPATVTHDYQYSAGQAGVCDATGRPLMSDGWADLPPVPITTWMASVWCVACHWSRHGSDETAVRNAARYHRVHPEQFEQHAAPRRVPMLGDTPMIRSVPVPSPGR